MGFVQTNGWAQTLLLSLKDLPQGISAEQIFVAGNFNGWNPKDSNYRFNNQGKLRIQATAAALLEFKCTLGSWEKVECNSNGSSISNRVIKLLKDTSVTIRIESFQHLHAGKPVVSTASANVHVLPAAVHRKEKNKIIRTILLRNM